MFLCKEKKILTCNEWMRTKLIFLLFPRESDCAFSLSIKVNKKIKIMKRTRKNGTARTISKTITFKYWKKDRPYEIMKDVFRYSIGGGKREEGREMMKARVNMSMKLNKTIFHSYCINELYLIAGVKNDRKRLAISIRTGIAERRGKLFSSRKDFGLTTETIKNKLQESSGSSSSRTWRWRTLRENFVFKAISITKYKKFILMYPNLALLLNQPIAKD